MMMKLAGGAGSVHPLDFNSRKRPVPRWVWLAVGASLLVHGAAGVWLYQQRFEMRAPAATPEPTITDVQIMPRPRRPEPETAQTPPPPTAVASSARRIRSSPRKRPRSRRHDMPVTGLAFDPIFVPATPGPVQPAAPAPSAPSTSRRA